MRLHSSSKHAMPSSHACASSSDSARSFSLVSSNCSSKVPRVFSPPPSPSHWPCTKEERCSRSRGLAVGAGLLPSAGASHVTNSPSVRASLHSVTRATTYSLRVPPIRPARCSSRPLMSAPRASAASSVCPYARDARAAAAHGATSYKPVGTLASSAMARMISESVASRSSMAAPTRSACPPPLPPPPPPLPPPPPPPPLPRPSTCGSGDEDSNAAKLASRPACDR